MAQRKRSTTAKPKRGRKQRVPVRADGILEYVHKVLPAEKLKTFPGNPRKGNLPLLRELIRRNGFADVLVIQKSTGHIVKGNHRFLAAVQLGMKKFPCFVVDVDDNRAEELLLAYNRSEDVSGYDVDKHAAALKRVAKRVGLQVVGYSQEAYDKIIADQLKKSGAAAAVERATAIHGKDYFPYAVYFVPRREVRAYKKTVGAARVVGCPDAINGNIARVRNFILHHYREGAKVRVLMIDDDVKCLMHSEGGRQQVKLSKEQAEAIVVHGFNLANDWGCVYWGINVNVDGRNYQQYKPFSLTQMILGPFCGHLDHDLSYDERVPLKDDYDFSLQVLQKYKKALRLNKYSYLCEHASNKGGCVSYRTRDVEEENARTIMAKWGRDVIRYNVGSKAGKPGDYLNGRVNVPIAGV